MTECIHGYPSLHLCPWCKHTPMAKRPTTTTVVADWEVEARRVLFELARSGEPFTSEDITDKIGFPGVQRANGNNKVGLFIQKHAARYGIRRWDQRPARNPQSHGRLLTVWKGSR